MKTFRFDDVPVLVWFHGGGYFAGSSIEQVAYDGFQMCMNGDVVVVTINHRLNILGYLDLSPFGEKYKNSGNAGHADMVAALKWVHDNITLFGEFLSFMPTQYDKNKLTKEQMKEIIKTVYGEDTDEIMKIFEETYPGKNPTDLLSIDRVMRQPSKRLAKLHAKGGKSGTYLYNFALEFPIQYNKIAWHCSDIPFFFHNTELVEVCQIPGVSEKLEAQIFEAFMAFARTGKPECDKLPKWESVTPDAEPTMIFDRECELRYNYVYLISGTEKSVPEIVYKC